jgi:pathogenesis-related protein 1
MKTSDFEYYDDRPSGRYRPATWISFKPIFLVLMLSLALAAAGAANAQSSQKAVECPGKNELSAAAIAEILSLHNQARQAVKVPALTWDCKLAQAAQFWASRGIFEHRTDPMFGESIFVSLMADVPAGAAVRKWMLEETGWNNAKGICQAGRICTHYTQAIWKKTARIGCGINRNPSGKWKVMIVCNYDPAGNSPGPAY